LERFSLCGYLLTILTVRVHLYIMLKSFYRGGFSLGIGYLLWWFGGMVLNLGGCAELGMAVR